MAAAAAAGSRARAIGIVGTPPGAGTARASPRRPAASAPAPAAPPPASEGERLGGRVVEDDAWTSFGSLRSNAARPTPSARRCARSHVDGRRRGGAARRRHRGEACCVAMGRRRSESPEPAGHDAATHPHCLQPLDQAKERRGRCRSRPALVLPLSSVTPSATARSGRHRLQAVGLAPRTCRAARSPSSWSPTAVRAAGAGGATNSSRLTPLKRKPTSPGEASPPVKRPRSPSPCRAVAGEPLSAPARPPPRPATPARARQRRAACGERFAGGCVDALAAAAPEAGRGRFGSPRGGSHHTRYLGRLLHTGRSPSRARPRTRHVERKVREIRGGSPSRSGSSCS